MRRMAWVLPTGLLMACGGQQEASDQARPETVAEDRAPDIGVTLLPGIALAYSNRFRLPAAAIAPVQERHAAACEQLGPQRCRITGLHYLADRPGNRSGSLDVALEPGAARAFGRAATLAVAQAKGSLVEQRITSENAGATAERARADAATAQARLRELERRLADRATRAEERAVLAEETAALRQRLDSSNDARATAMATLANTPMHFDYEAGDLVPGFDLGAPLREAVSGAASRFVGALAMVISVLAALLPWAIAIGFVFFLWRRFVAPRLNDTPPPTE